ncbi:MAG: hypothetical protein L0219_04950, partial [Phycisphaerales bacterium]|nr:hypothetical protein [Phycisphaerales bacterium]
MRAFSIDIDDVARPAALMIWTLPVTMAALVLFSLPTRATNFSWNTGNGIFASPANWAQSGPVDADGVPDDDDMVIFNRGNVSPYTVSYSSLPPLVFPRQETVDRLVIGTNTVAFDGISDEFFGDSSLTVDSTVTGESGRGMIIGQTGTDVAVLNSSLPGGISTIYATLGAEASSSGTFNVNSSAFSVTGTAALEELIVGLNGTGTIIVGNGSVVTVAGDTA